MYNQLQARQPPFNFVPVDSSNLAKALSL